MSQLPRRIEKPYLIVSEGITDVHFCKSASRFFYDACDDVEIRDVGGVDNLRNYLAGLKSATGFHNLKSMLVVRDAEQYPDPVASIRDALQNAQLPAPERPFVFESGYPRVAYAILPGIDGEGNVKPGCLEDLLLESVANSPLLACVDQFLRCQNEIWPKASASDDFKLGQRNPSKFRLHSYLAICGFAGVPIGQATTKGVWGSLDHECFKPLRAVFQSLRTP